MKLLWSQKEGRYMFIIYIYVYIKYIICLDYMFFLELIKKTSGCKFV